MKITYIFFGSVYGIFILFVSIGSAANYTFTCDKPHRNDNVIGYKVYYRLNSGTYDGEFRAVSIADPKFDRVKHTWKINLPDVAEEYCFAATAWDADDFESYPSYEVGYGKTCGQINYADIVEQVGGEDGGGGGGGGDGGGGGGGGGCFIGAMEVE